MFSRRLLVLCVFVVSAVAVPLTKREECARHCTGKDDLLLTPGNTYTYDYETTTVTAVHGTTQDKSQLQMTAQVDIQVLSKCDLSLRLRGVTLKQSDTQSPDYLNSIRGGREFAKAVERHILRFSYQNGRVEHVCPSEEVPSWVTNIQKGVLSAFQTSMVEFDGTERVVETDVSGKCTAEYQSLGRSWQGTLTIRKQKDLSKCTDRQNVDTSLQGTPYTENFHSRSRPLVTGSQECEQVIGNKILQSSSCTEKHIFRPFSKGGHGVVTTVNQKLTYATISQRSFTGNDYRPTTEPLLFSHLKEEASSSRRDEETEHALKELCEAAKQDVSITVPSKFSAFVYKMKKLPLSSFKSLYQRIDSVCEGTDKARKFFMDAIPLVGTSESARFIADMISTDAVSESESNFWLTSLSFMTEPTAEMIETFTPLFEGKYDQAFLGISAVIHTFCKSHDCSSVPQVRNAVYRLVENLGENCYNPEERKIIMTLKALSNIGQIFDKESIILSCSKNPQVRTEVRVAAIQVFRRVSCDVSRQDLMEMFKNSVEDSELRVAAYLAVMKCPTEDTLIAVRETLEMEKVDHVVSFVWTHLNAMAKSSHPERQDIREIVSNLRLLNKYESDIRKFSSAREATFYLESIDSGFHVDNHIVFTTDSYLPRTATFNLTVDVFGHTCNLFQIDGRMEGLERVVESFFGPSGYFPQKDVAKMLRDKRSISNNKLELMDQQFDAKSRFNQQPYGSLDVKVFGNSLFYKQIREGDDGLPNINIMDIITKLSEQQEKEYSRSFMFLDTTFTVPMASGLPLRIAVNGTASVGLKIGGKFNVRSFQNVDILGHIEPSGAIEIASLLTVDAGNAARSGLRVVGTMHSSTVLDGQIEVKKGEIVRAQLNMPRDRIDIINMKSTLYLVHGPEEREQTRGKREGTHIRSCTGDKPMTLFGVKLCSEIQLPAYKPNSPLHPINGAAQFSVYILKTDPSLKSYNFDAQWSSDSKNGEAVRRAVFSLNTPDSKMDRDVKAEFYFNQADHTAMFKIRTPVKKLAVNAKMTNEEMLKKLDLSLIMDDKEYFSAQTELRTTSDKGAISYTPSLEIRLSDKRLAAVSGSAYLKHGQKYTGQLQIEDLTEKPIIAKGNMEIKNQDRYEGELSFSSFALDGTVKGYTQLGGSMSSRINVEYRLLAGRMYRINVIGKMRDLSANALQKYTGTLNVQASALPEWNTDIAFETQKTTGHLENTISISLGDGVRSRIHTIKLQEIIRYSGDMWNNKAEASLSLAYPEKNLDYSMNVNHENTERTLKNSIEIQYGPNKKVNSVVDLSMKKESPMSFAGDVKLSYPGRNTGISIELSESNPNEYRSTVSLQWQEGRRLTGVIHYKDRTRGSQLKYEVDGQLTLPSRSPITFVSTVGTQQGQFAGFVELNVGVDKYRLKADYAQGTVGINHRLTGQLVMNNDWYGTEAFVQVVRGKLTSNVEFKLPNRHRITAKLEGRMGDSFKSGTFETLWDADRDPSKRFGLTTEIREHADGYDGKFTMQVRHRVVKGTMTTNLQGKLFSSQWKTNNKFELEWAPKERISISMAKNVLFDRSRQQIGSSFEVLTPYYGYENITLGWTHMYANQQWISDATTSWSDKHISISSTGKYSFVRGGASVETTAKVQTKFRDYEEMSVEIYHDHNTQELTNKAQVKWGPAKRITTQVTGSMQPSEFKGGMKLSTPFAHFRDLSADVSHSYTAGNYRSYAEFQWAARKKVIVNFDGRHSLNGRRRLCTINLAASTPFRDFENTVAKITLNNDGVTLNAEAEATLNGHKKVTAGFTGSMRNSLYNKNMESKMHFTSPIESYENIQIATSLELNENSYKVNIDTQLPHRSTASLNSQGKMTSINDIEVNAVLIGHFPNYIDPKRASIDFVHKLQNSNLRSTLDASYGEKQVTVLLIGMTESSYRSRNVEFSLTVTTPATAYGEMKADFLHNQRGNDYLTKAQLSKNSMNVALTHKLNVRDMMNFETTLEMTSTTSMPSAKVSIVQVSGADQIEHNSFAQWGKNSKINLNAQYFDKSTSKEFVVKLNTPYRKIRDVEFKSVYEHQNWQRKSSLSLTWNRNNKMTLDGNLRNYYWKNFLAQAEFTSTFQGYDYYKFGSKYDVTLPKKTMEFDFQWGRSEDKIVTAKGTFLNSDPTIHLEAEVRTPFDDLDRVSLSAKYENAQPETSVSLVYQRGWRKITLEGKSVFRSNGADINIDFSSPYEMIKELSTSAKYKKLREGMSAELSTQLNRDYKYKISGQYEITGYTANGRLAISTPIREYESVNFETSLDNGYPKKSVSFTMHWGDNKKVLLSGDYDAKRYNGGEMTLNMQSSFDKLKEMTVHSSYNLRSSHYEGELKVTINRRNIYHGSVDMKSGGQHLGEVKFTVDTPHSPFRNVQLVGFVDYEDGRCRMTSTMKWEDKEMETSILLARKEDKFFEAKFQLNTPFEDFRVFSFDSSLRNDGFRFIDGRVNAITPFEAMRNLQLVAEYKSDESGCGVLFKMDTPSRKMNIVGNVSNRRFQPFTASLEVDAPFTTFQKLTVTAYVNLKHWNDAIGRLSISTPRATHAIGITFAKDDSNLNLELNVECPMLRSGTAVFKVKADYDDPSNVDAEATAQVYGKTHYLNAQFRDSGREMLFTGRAESPMLPGRKADLSATLSRRRNNKVMEGKITFTLPSSTHVASAKYETNSRQMSVNAKIESGMMPFETLESEVKYVNGNSRDLEVSASLAVAEETYSVVGSLKNYETEKFFQLKLTCPRMNPISVTATLKHDEFQAMDGSLSISYPGNEIRIAGNMKRVRYENLEAFLTINTPFQALRMLRLDGRFNNDKFRNIDCNFQLETSNRNLPSLGLTSKLSRTEGSEDLSLMLHLPHRTYNTIQLLVNAHYNSDYTVADSRATLSFAAKRYSVYGQYGIEKPRISGATEIDWDKEKWAASGRFDTTDEKKSFSLSIKKPNSDVYNIGGGFANSGNLYSVAATYTSPDGDVYDSNTTMRYNNPVNFDLEFRVNTPFRNYKNVQGSVQQQYNSNYISTNIEYIKNGRRGYVRILHRSLRSGATGSVQIGCPYSKLNDVKLSYSHLAKHPDMECSLELDYNRVKQFKAELMKYAHRSMHVLVDVPVLPLTVTANEKKENGGRVINFKSNYLSRIVAFTTSYKRDQNQLLHDAAFTWDERMDRKISYDFKMIDTVAGNFKGKELFGKVDFPLRSVILKGNFTRSSRTRSGGVELYWDAARNLEKHMSVGAEHQDLSTQKKTSHKLQIQLAHPKLPRELIQTNIFTLGDSTLHLKSEFQYSQQRRDNILVEVVGNAVTADPRETHYRGEMTVRHPPSKIDIRAVAELMDNKLESTANMRLNHVDRRFVQRVHEIKAKIFKLRQQIDVMMKANDDQTTLQGKMNGRLGEFDMSIEQKVNEQRNLMTSVMFSKRSSRLDFSVKNAANTGFQVSAAFPKESASLRISHSSRGEEVTDANIYLGLEQSRILKSQVNWRPKMWEELRITTGENLRAFLRSAKRSYESATSSFSEELNFRMDFMRTTLKNQLMPFLKDMEQEMTAVANDIAAVKTTFRTMYRNNEFHMKDIQKGYEEAKQIVIYVRDFIAMAFDTLSVVVIEYAEDFYYTVYYAWQDFAEYTQKMHSELLLKTKVLAVAVADRVSSGVLFALEKTGRAVGTVAGKLRQGANYVVLKVDKLMRAYAPCIIDGYYYTKNVADRFRGCVTNLYSTTTRYITSSEYYVAITKYIDSVMNTIQAFRDMEYRDTAQEFLNRMYNMRIMESLLNHPHVEYLSSVTNSALRKGVEVYHTLGMDSVVASAVESMTQYAKNLALNTAQELLEELYQVRGGAKYEFEPRRGHMALEFHLPTTRNSLIEVFDFKSYPEYQKVMNMKNNIVSEYYEDFCVWDFYYKIVKYFTPSYWLPNFTAHAMISGNQHYITFDKLPFEFAGQCSYLLARDFVDGNFTVVVNYARDESSVVRKSLTILTEGKKVDIGGNYKVAVDDVKTELPIQIAKTVVIREGSIVRVENDHKGFSIVCNFVHNYCTVSVSGFYFGKTAGLFGTYNYHPSLDMMTPGRYFAKNVEEFASSWEIGQGSCERAENLATLPANDYRVQQRCKALFQKSTSDFRACFKQVNPEAYMRMCVNDLSAVHEHRFENTICISAAAYFAECKMEGVPLKMPRQCVRCEKQDGGMMTEGDSVKFTSEDATQAADVVFLIEEKPCSEDKVRTLGKLAQGIEENFRNKGYRDVRYTVVGFGGDEVHAMPHVHTMDGQESGHLRYLESALQSLVYGDGPVNILEALRFAAALNFRPGTTKSFVLVKCSTCKAEEVKAEYGEMLRTLLDGDITLHLLMEQRYEMKVANKNSKARKVIGVDRKFAYTLKDVKDSRLSGDGDLLAQLKIPKDVCVPLALEVNGSSFDSQFLTETRKNTNKKFMDVLARLVVRSSERRTEWIMCCECIATADGVGKSACQRCVSEEMAMMVSGSTSGFNMYSEVDDSNELVRKHKQRRGIH